MSFTTQLLEGLQATSAIEWIAVSSSVIYVVLAAKRLILCWFFAFIASVLFVYLCYMGKLYIEALLQFFYVVMALVGWFSWKHSSSSYPNKLNWCVKSILFNLYRTILCGDLMRILLSHFRIKKSIYKLFWQEYLSKIKWFKSDFWFC